MKNHTNYRIAAYDDLDCILNKINKLVADKHFSEDVRKLLENLRKTALAVSLYVKKFVVSNVRSYEKGNYN